MRLLGLHQITLKELDPFAFIDVAARCGYDQVSLFTNAPNVPQAGREGMFVFPTVTPEIAGEVRRRLDDAGLAATGAEFFLMTPDADLDAYTPGLSVGRQIGARHAVTHVFDTEPGRAVETLGRFCELAAAHDLKVGIEFCPMTPGCKSLGQAKWYVDEVGAPNLGFGICPLHTTRSGGTPADLAALDERYFVFGQINDGHGCHASAEYFAEVHDRELPGDGDFLLHDLLSALPADLPIEVKIPCESRGERGFSAFDFAREAAVRSRSLLDGLDYVRR